jgi:GT2 family glycosyltransferase
MPTSSRAATRREDRAPGPPEIAVVIPTHRRESRLAFALEALADQTVARGRFEVIVVRNSGLPGPKVSSPDGLVVRFLEDSRRSGPSAKRNRAWRATVAPLVAFMDDDCRPAPDWLERMLEAQNGAHRILQGRTEPDPSERHLLHGLARSQLIKGPSRWYQCCNIAYPRALLDRVGGFDEGFVRPGGEDTDLGIRAREAGAALAYVDGAVVWHAVHSHTLIGAVREAARWDGMGLLFARHPGQRQFIYRRFFWRRSHALLLLALTGGLLWRRSKVVGALATVPYIEQNVARPVTMTPRRLVRVALHLVARFIVDLVEVLATARGGVKHRVPVV